MNQVSLIVQNYIQYINKVISNHKLSHSYLIEINNYDEDLSLVYSFIKMIFNDCTYEDLNNICSDDYHFMDVIYKITPPCELCDTNCITNCFGLENNECTTIYLPVN